MQGGQPLSKMTRHLPSASLRQVEMNVPTRAELKRALARMDGDGDEAGGAQARERVLQMETLEDRVVHIIRELERLGIRRDPVLTFLHRQHPVNVFLGKYMTRLGLR